jgi:flagellar basal body-associated protein FliL
MAKTIIVAVLVAVVILTEGLFAYLLIPSRSDLEKWSAEKAAKAAHSGEDGHDGHDDGGHGHKSEHGHEHEVDLGKYNVIVHHPTSTVTLRVNFHLIGTVNEKEHHEFEEMLAKNQHRLRDQAIFEIRNCQVEDLTDPGLALLKRRILAKSNDLLGKPLLRSVVFSDFSFVEQ